MDNNYYMIKNKFMNDKEKLDILLSEYNCNKCWFINQLDYIKFDFIKSIDIYYIIGIDDFKDFYKNKFRYGFKFKLNHFYGYSTIMIKDINYKLYENIFDFVFSNSYKFHFSINEKIRNSKGEIIKNDY